ncbi:TIMELESS-interacting protein-like [Poeciliopsis prolifica]|uniref:TIMELESS-interacting protein-like n=1 Tax=Poeciliopsis prolifica TaxID=188132 RepID=UPI0024142706|nr:TIMELESS-interacting protein-like [Poeciliopsis prolifica]
MNDQQDDGMSDLSNLEDEAFPPLPPPLSPGAAQSQDDSFGEAEDGEVSKLADVPAAKRKGVKRPQPKLDSQRLISDRGLPALRSLFASAHFKGKGHEAEDLRLLMQKMENWAHRLFPKLQFEDFIDRVEKLGSKKEVQTCLKRIRLDMPLTDEDFMDKPGAEEPPPGVQDPDPFVSQASFPDPPGPVHSTPASVPAPPTLTEEQRRRMEQNRQRALERRLARQQQADPSEPQADTTTGSDLTADLNGSTEQNQKPGEHLDPDPSGSTKTPPPAVSEPDPPAELPTEEEKGRSPSSQP